MNNLLNETLEILKNHDKAESDVAWVGTDTIMTSFDNFKIISNFEYDNGFGRQEINPYLIVVGKDFWLERHEYDGREWWEYKEMPERKEVVRLLSKEDILNA